MERKKIMSWTLIWLNWSIVTINATEEGKIRVDKFVQINLTVLTMDGSRMHGHKEDGSRSHVTSTWFK